MTCLEDLEYIEIKGAMHEHNADDIGGRIFLATNSRDTKELARFKIVSS